MTFALAAWCWLAAIVAAAQPVANYPPDRPVDFEHLRVELSIPDMDRQRMHAMARLRMTALAEPVSRLHLDAKLLDIGSVTMGGQPVEHSHNGTTLTLEFDPPLEPARRVEVQIDYLVENPPRGLIWTTSSRRWPGRPPQIHTQGEPEDNSYWLPCHDFPNDRLTSELIVSVPAGFVVSSNGSLVSITRTLERVSTDGDGQALVPYDVFHWAQDERAGGDHVAYLISLVVGKFDIVDVGDESVSMPVYVPPGRARDVEATYGRTLDMNRFFERYLDEPYPWRSPAGKGRYAQVLVWNFAHGGMENTGATTMYGTALFSPEALADHDLDGLISHELAHQWFGDLITCRSWEHIWLNEGFATYLTSLWFEHARGPDAFLASMVRNADSIIARDRVDHDQPMVSHIYEHPFDTFRKPANPYSKGACVLHMLRQTLGDDAFRASVRSYVDRHAHGLVETADLRRAFEEVSGESLQQFFEQWCQRTGIPRLTITGAWDAGRSEYVIDIEQTQPVTPSHPAFVFDLPVFFWGPGGEQVMSVRVDERHQRAAFALPRAPDLVSIDPGLAVLAEFELRLGDEMLLRLLERGNLVARVRAARALRESPDDRVPEALLQAARSTGLHPLVQIEAIRALAERGDDRRIADLLTDAEAAAPSVLVAVLDAAGTASLTTEDPIRTTVIERITQIIRSHPAGTVRASALRALGELGALEQAHVVIDAMTVASQHDEVRRAALGALQDLQPREGLSHAITATKLGIPARTRPDAIAAVVALAHVDADRAFNAIADLVHDPERRTREAAARALVELGDPRGVEVLLGRLDVVRDDQDKDRLHRLIEELHDSARP